MIDLILKDITDPHVRENFFRISKFIESQLWFDGEFRCYDIIIPDATESFSLKHGLPFTPTDVIPLYSEGDYNFYFKYADFDASNIVIVAGGPVRIRFLAGRLRDQIRNKLQADLSFVAPGGVSSGGGSGGGSSSTVQNVPGYLFNGVHKKGAESWLTLDGVPSNVVGVPVPFGSGRVLQAAVGTEVEADYTIGVYQHQGLGAGLTLLGTFDIVSGGSKRISLNYPIFYSSNNVQLACKIEAGETLNLKVTLLVKGTTV